MSGVAIKQRLANGPSANGFDVARVRADFPILSSSVYGKPLVFLDTAASAQKPRQVIDAVSACYEREYANVHRGVYWLSQRTTDAFEAARAKTGAFINARQAREIIFVRQATEGINLVAQSYGRTFLEEGDEVVVTEMEHHSNIVPWQMLRDEKGITLKVIPITDSGELVAGAAEALITERTKLVAVAQIANALGTILPVHEIARLARERGAKVLIDGCQAVPHMPVDVQDLDCDFYVFSGHKLYGPTGIGVLYGKAELLEAMPPYQGGGEMIQSVTFEKTEYAGIPHKFEAGTPHIAGAVGLGAAIDYINAIGLERIGAHESALFDYAMRRLSEVPGLRHIGTAQSKTGVLSFLLGDVHAHDIGTILDREGVAVRVGHHCAQPVMDRFGIPSTVRASIGLYNTRADIDALVSALGKVKDIFG